MRNRAREVIEVLETIGWTKGNYRTPNGFCMLGAFAYNESGASDRIEINKFYAYQNSYYKIQDSLAVVLDCIQDQYPLYGGPEEEDIYYIALFNDAFDTDYSQVVSILEKAAAKIDESDFMI